MDKSERRKLKAQLRKIAEQVRSTPLKFPNRASLLGLVNAALVAVIDPVSKAGRNEFRLHIADALEPLGLAITRKKRKTHRN